MENFHDCNNFFYNKRNDREQRYFCGKRNGFSSEINENFPTTKETEEKWIRLEGESFMEIGGRNLEDLSNNFETVYPNL